MLLVKGVSELDLEQWKATPIAEAVIKAVRAKQEQLERDLGRGNYVDVDDPQKTHGKSCEAKGRWSAYEDFITMQAG
jgi:hypothetical protein